MQPVPEQPPAGGWFDDVFATTYPDVLRFAARRVGADRAADVAAETFLVAWRRRDDLPRDNVRAWLFRVASNVIANSSRAEVRQARVAGRLQVVPDEPLDGDGVDVLRVRAILASLPPDDQEALRLVEWDGLTPAEAATVAGCSTVAFRVRLHRARNRFAAAYGRNR